MMLGRCMAQEDGEWRHCLVAPSAFVRQAPRALFTDNSDPTLGLRSLEISVEDIFQLLPDVIPT